MKEFQFNLSEHLVKGLSPEPNMRGNSQFLSVCKNAKPSERGIVPYEPVTYPLLNDFPVDWPFPQVFKMRQKTLFFSHNKVYMLNEEDWSYWELDLVNLSGVNAGLSRGAAWALVDLDQAWIATNLINTVFYTDRHVMLGQEDKVYTTKNFSFSAGCHFRGRWVLGGFNYENFWNSAWQSIWNDWSQRSQTDFVTTRPKPEGDIVMPMEQNMIFWSTIGGGDLLNLFHPGLAQTGLTSSSYDATDPLLFDYWERNEAGFKAMPFQGLITNIKSMDLALDGRGAFIVYGDNGIGALVPFGKHLGYRHILDYGVYGRGAVAGSESEHVFVDKRMNLWKINASLQAERLGYRNQLVDMKGTDILVNYNPEQREYHISNGGGQFILTQSGLGQSMQKVTSLAIKDGEVFGVSSDYFIGDTNIELVTEPFDMGIRALKFIRAVGFDLSYIHEVADDTEEIEAALYYRGKGSDYFLRSPFVPINKEGISHLRVAGTEFKVVFRINSQLGDAFQRLSNLGQITIFYSIIDKRNVRGLSANQTTADANQ